MLSRGFARIFAHRRRTIHRLSRSFPFAPHRAFSTALSLPYITALCLARAPAPVSISKSGGVTQVGKIPLFSSAPRRAFISPPRITAFRLHIHLRITDLHPTPGKPLALLAIFPTCARTPPSALNLLYPFLVSPPLPQRLTSVLFFLPLHLFPPQGPGQCQRQQQGSPQPAHAVGQVHAPAPQKSGQRQHRPYPQRQFQQARTHGP